MSRHVYLVFDNTSFGDENLCRRFNGCLHVDQELFTGKPVVCFCLESDPTIKSVYGTRLLLSWEGSRPQGLKTTVVSLVGGVLVSN